MILGICGKLKHGKDTFARILIERNPTFKRLAFADRLKQICIRVYGLTDYQVSEPSAKEQTLPAPLVLDQRLDALRLETGLPNIQPAGLVATTPRQVLQYVGTDYVRCVDDNYWLDAVVNQIKADPTRNYAITDVRFPNEAMALRSLGGYVIRILRLAHETSTAPEHASEKLEFYSDFTLGVTENDMSLFAVLAHLSSTPPEFLRALHASDFGTFSFWGPFLVTYYNSIFPEMCQTAAGVFKK